MIDLVVNHLKFIKILGNKMHNRNKIFISIFILISNISIAQEINVPIVLVSDKTEGGPIFLNYKDIFGDFIRVNFTQEAQQNTVKLFMKRPILLEFNANFKQYPVYAKPGDTIFISTHSQNNYYEFKTRGYSNYRINFFNFLDDYGYGMGYPDFFNRVFKASNYKNSLEFSFANYKNRLYLLNKYKSEHKLDVDFCDFAQLLVDTFYTQALLTPYLTPISESQYNALPKNYSAIIYKSPLGKILKQSKWVNSSSSYRGMLVSYIRFLSRNSLYTSEELPTLYRNALDSLSGESRDYLLFFLMKNNIQRGGGDISKLYRKFHYDCVSQEYKTYIDSIFSRINGVVSNPNIIKTELEDTSGQKISWEDILVKNKDKVLYIDFWASWCIPCLEQIPFSKKMESNLSGKKIIFIYISVDKDKNKWLNSIRINTLSNISSQHYLLSDKSSLATYLGIPPIPHYFTIDREGRPVFWDSTRPDNPATLKELERLSEN